MKQRICTIKDVALHAGVSVGTASKAINNIYVRPEAKARVDKAVKELGYVPNAMARGLKVQSSRTIGVLVPDISKSVNNRVLRGISDRCAQLNYSVMIADFNLLESNVIRNLKMFVEKKVDGIIYASNNISLALRDEMEKTGIPIVLVMTNGRDTSFPKITIDNEEAACYAIRRLIELGHRDILMLGGEEDDYNAGMPRINGYRRALEEAGIPIREELISNGRFEYDRGYKETLEKLDRGEKFTAVFAAADLTAFGVMRALYERNLRVPEDISVVGFDGIDASRYVVPELSTIHQPFRKYGEMGAELLIRIIEGDTEGEDIRLAWTMQEGSTMGPVKKEDPAEEKQV